MKPDETQRYVKDIPRQCTASNIRPMNTQTFTLTQPTAWLPQSRIWSTAFGALLLCASAVQAAEPQPRVSEQALELSQPQAASVTPMWRKAPARERQSYQPYGSGYEARGLGEAGKSDAEVISGPSTSPTAGSGRSGGGSGGSGGSSGGGSGGAGGSGGRGR